MVTRKLYKNTYIQKHKLKSMASGESLKLRIKLESVDSGKLLQ